MAIFRNTVDRSKFNRQVVLPYELRPMDFEIAMQDVYDFFYDVNTNLAEKDLERLDDMLRPAIRRTGTRPQADGIHGALYRTSDH